MATATLRPYRLTVALPHPAGNDVLLPPGAQVTAEAAAAAVAAADLMTAWTSVKVLLSMTVEVRRDADALSTGWTGACGDTAGALRLLIELLPDQERVLGPDHPYAHRTRNRILSWG